MLTKAEISAAASRIVERTCAEQNLPPTIEDAAVLERVAAVLGGRRDEAPTEAGASATFTTTDYRQKVEVPHVRT